jgi:sec-independent protein translocase protein TatB
MDFLGIGPLELIVILVIALIVVGPERLPELARSARKTINQLTSMSSALTEEWTREVSSVADVDLIAEGKQIRETLAEPMKAVQASLESAVMGSPAPPPEEKKEPDAQPATELRENGPDSPSQDSSPVEQPPASSTSSPATIEPETPSSSDNVAGENNDTDHAND